MVYDPSQVSYADLVKRFFEVHDPTQGMRQGNDVGTQYRSAIYFTTPEQEKTARELTEVYGAELRRRRLGEITTEGQARRRRTTTPRRRTSSTSRRTTSGNRTHAKTAGRRPDTPRPAAVGGGERTESHGDSGGRWHGMARKRRWSKMRCARLVATQPVDRRDDPSANRRPPGRAVVPADHDRRGGELRRGDAPLPGHLPLLAPLTAMLVVQVTPVSLLASGLDRVVAVVSGVSLAVAFASVVPLGGGASACSSSSRSRSARRCGCDRTSSRSRSAACSCSASARSSAESAAWQRIAETLVGAAVGITANLLFPPKVASADAGRAIDGLADSVSDLLSRAADELDELVADGGDVGPAARDWLGEARRITHDIPRVGAALLNAEQGRRLNVRAVGTPDVGPGLRQGLEALEHSAVAIRGMLRALADATHGRRGRRRERRRRAPGPRADDARDGRRGRRVRSAGPRRGRSARSMSPADVQVLREALEGLHEARAGSRTCSWRAPHRGARAPRSRALDRQAAAERDGPRRADPAAGPDDAPEPFPPS